MMTTYDYVEYKTRVYVRDEIASLARFVTALAEGKIVKNTTFREWDCQQKIGKVTDQ